MKMILLIPAVILCSVFFLSCRNDSPTVSNNLRTDFYNWSVVSDGLEGISGISAGSDRTVFTAGIKSYRISNGIRTELNFQEEKFTPTEVKAMDENYAVFLGYRSFPSDTAFFKIYDNGKISTHSVPMDQSEFLANIFILEKDKFYIANEGPLTWYEFNKGNFIKHSLPNNHTPLKFTKLNNEVYLVSQYENNLFKVFFKIENGSYTIVRNEAPDGKLFFLNDDIIKVMEDNFTTEFYRFTNNGWDKFYSSYTNSNGEQILYLSGNSKNLFSAITVDNQYNFHGWVWTGNKYSEQANFPQGLSSFNTLGRISDYKSDAFYFYHSDAKKLFMAKKN